MPTVSSPTLWRVRCVLLARVAEPDDQHVDGHGGQPPVATGVALGRIGGGLAALGGGFALALGRRLSGLGGCLGGDVLGRGPQDEHGDDRHVGIADGGDTRRASGRRTGG